MHIILEKVLDENGLSRIRALLATEEFTDGRQTSTVLGKNNTQLSFESPPAQAAGELISNQLLQNEMFAQAAYPHRILPFTFSKYEVGMSYPQHVDSAVMDSYRTDIALTVFLSDLDSYGGGELVIETGNGERRYRLAAGDAVVYPASTLHCVAPVVFGTRLVAVSWVQSLVRDPLKRQVLYDLGCSVASLSDSAFGARLRRSYQNLLRLWAEA
jgi:PKHD-type hydroxylase